jgi:hypothetical protein
MNELKSYTEYAVSTPTADFVIGFDFNYGEDAVNVTVDGAPTAEAGYTVVYLNETTIRLSPSVPSGVVRLQRGTDIDKQAYVFRAGAKFVASNVDANFAQILHSQQEVRDQTDAFYTRVDAQIDNFAIQVADVQAGFIVVQAVANSAELKASNAVLTATTALNTANAIDIKATTALNNANTAVATANSVDAKATQALTNSNNAETVASTALSTATGIDSKATNALNTANASNSTATTALSTANTALVTANGIDAKATQAQLDASTALDMVTTQKGVANGIAPLNANTKIEPIYIESMDVLPYLPLAYPKSTPPTGYLAMMGQAISQETYPILYALYGATLPDMRAYTIRGLDYGRGIDVGRVVLSLQDDQIKAHTHSAAVQGGIAIQPTGSWSYRDAVNGQTGSTGGGETRVKNIAFLYIVKAG